MKMKGLCPPSVFFDQCHPKLVKGGETDEDADRASFKLCSQDVGLKIFFSQAFLFPDGKKKS